MIKRFLHRPQFYLALFFALLFIFPKSGSHQLRNFAISGISPSWRVLHQVKIATKSLFTNTTVDTKQVEQLKIENQRLMKQLERYDAWLTADQRIQEEYEQLKEITGQEALEFFQRRANHLKTFLKLRLKALPAQVIFRDPALWSSTLWLNVGERDNRGSGAQIIMKNSPVVVGRSIVGVVEEVCERKCRIRLITDQRLTPSVRAVRGGAQNRLLSHQIDQIVTILATRDDLKERDQLLEVLADFSQNLDRSIPDLYLAKGEIQGASGPLLRGLSSKLKGMGFNYDFSDEEGQARDLRSGYGGALIKVGDLLVTTGMDGIFPADLRVGIVSKIFPLQEGGIAYDLEATPLVANLGDLHEVFVLPPL